MKQALKAIGIALAISLMATVGVFASVITGATYSGIVRITNNGTAATNVSTVYTLNTSEMMAQGFINTSANNVAIRTNGNADTPFMPGAAGNESWVVWVPSILSGTNTPYIMYTGGGDMGSLIRYFPGTGGMSTTDNASMELGSNFTISQTGWFDTTNLGGGLVSKPGAIATNVTSSGNITTVIFSSTNASSNISPNGAGNYTNIPSVQGAATHWQAVDDPPGASDNDTTYVYSATPTAWTADVYAMNATSVPSDAFVHSVTVYFRTKKSATGNMWQQPILRLGGVETVGTNTSKATNANYVTHTELLARPGGGQWSVADMAALEVGIGIVSDDANHARVTQVYAVISYSVVNQEVSAIGVTSDNHTVNIKANGTFLSTWVDNVTADTPLSENLTLNLPLYHYDMAGSPLTSKDDFTRTGTITGTPSWNTSGRSFDGVTEKIVVPALPVTNNLTMMGWFLHLGGNSSAANANMIGAGNYRIYQPTANDPSIWNFFLNPAGGSVFLPFIGESTNVWHHFAMVYDGANAVLYSDNVIGTPSAATGNLSAGTFDIGGGTGGQTNILVGEVQSYPRAFNTTEVSTNYNRTIWKYNGAADIFDYDALAGNTTVNNANNWTFSTAPATTYLQSHNLTTGNITRQRIAWVYNSATPYGFPDASGNGNTAVPTFRIATSNGNVTANLTSYTPISQSTSDATTPVLVAGNLTEDFVEPPGMYTELTIATPGASWINEILDGQGIPRAIFWFPFLFGFVALTGIFTFFLTKSILIQGTIMGFLIILISLMGGFGYWVAIEFIIYAIAIILGSRQFGF